jgi:PPM family protein phosphatase
MNLRFSFASKQTIGTRKSQEDFSLVRRFRLSNPQQDRVICALLSDGMGGHVAGERASRLVVNSFWNAFEQAPSGRPEKLIGFLREANDCLRYDIERNPEYSGMGATFLAVIVWNDMCSWISVGDSPLLLVRNGKIVQLNADHSMAPVLDQMALDGTISRDEALADPRRQSLRAAIIGRELDLIDQGEPFLVQSGDRLLLASDGIETLSREQIAAVIGHFSETAANEAVQMLVNGVENIKRKNQDNATAILLCAHTDEGEI